MFQASSPPLRVAPSPPLPTAYCPETDDETIAEINAALRRDAKPTTRRRRGTVGYRRDNADGRAALVPAAKLPIGAAAILRSSQPEGEVADPLCPPAQTA